MLLDLPLESLHKDAFKAAEATRCAADQGKYWEMHDRLFAEQQRLAEWQAHAKAVGLDVAAFEECMRSERHAFGIRKDMAQAAQAGITGTPGFVIARTDPDDPSKVTGQAFIRGAQAFAAFKGAIDAALAELE